MAKIFFEGITIDEFFELQDAYFQKLFENSNNGTSKGFKDKLRTREEVCEILHISLPTFHRWSKSGKLKVHKAGGRILVRQSDIDAAVHEVSSQKYRSPP
jgi:excisionase family DNA binding protein